LSATNSVNLLQLYQQHISELAPEQRLFISKVSHTPKPVCNSSDLWAQVQSGHNVFLTGLGGTGKYDHRTLQHMRRDQQLL
jgi:hypothetical protein